MKLLPFKSAKVGFSSQEFIIARKVGYCKFLLQNKDWSFAYHL